MAVSFKVPSSPSKSIFEMDTFLGVDVTNNGTNIEDNRSPNAPNMVRQVPGKVRKRTGYHTDIVFGTSVNVNRAVGSSCEETVFYPVADENTLMYNLAGSYDSGVLDFDYKCADDFTIDGIEETIPSSEEWTHFTGTFSTEEEVNFLSLKSETEQDICIKYLSFCESTDEKYEWNPCPRHFIERSSDDPIYGVHEIRNGIIEGDRVSNVNRAIGTHNQTGEDIDYDTSEWETTTVGGFGSVLLYNTQDDYCKGRHFIIRLKYEATNEVILKFGTVEMILAATQADSPVEVQVEGDLTATLKKASASIYASSLVSGTTFKYCELSLMYSVNSSYKWGVSPEELGKTFPIEDTYKISPTNYALVEEYNGTTKPDTTLATDWYRGGDKVIVGNSTQNVKGFAHISFYIQTSCYNYLKKFTFQIRSNVSGNSGILYEEERTTHYNNEKMEFFFPLTDTTYIERLKVTYEVTGREQFWFNVSDIKINTIEPTEVYDIKSKYIIYHTGKDLYLYNDTDETFKRVYNKANEKVSQAWQMDNTIYFIDGANIYSYVIGADEITALGDNEGYIPTVTISKRPKGGGISYYPLNMLQSGFYEQFLVTESDIGAQSGEYPVNYYLSFQNLDAKEVKVWVMDSNGDWVEKKEKTDFVVNRGEGKITFITTRPSKSPITGEDNVKVLAYRTVPGYKERITNCTLGTLFGVNGSTDRLFLSGNPDYPNYDFFSEQYDPSYFPDTGYSMLGLSSSAIKGYAIINNYLAAFKDEYEPSQSVFIREGDLITDEETGISSPAFKLINTLQGHGVIAANSFAYLNTEPLFLTRSGIYAITSQDITGEKYGQSRSFYLNGMLLEEKNLENAYAVAFNDYYVMALNNKLYLLDGLQPTRTDKSEPYATRQYVAFYCLDIPATCLWVEDQALHFGTEDGKVCVFATDTDALESYNDNGKAIECCWETPDLDGKLFYKNKSFRYIAIRMMSALKTSARLSSMARGSWNFIKEDNNTGIYFDFENVDFNAFSFSTDRTDKVAHSKIRVKKVDKARFKIENNKINEPFGLMNLALEYIESGNYKG